MRKVNFPLVHTFLVLALLLPGLSLGVPHQLAAAAHAAGYTISGRVTDGGGNGVEGVTIRAVLDNYMVFLPSVTTASAGTPASTNPPSQGRNFYTGQTDANGYYSLDDLPAGRYLVAADKAGMDFAPYSHSVISSSANNPYDFHVTSIPTVPSPLTNILSDAATGQLISISSDGSTYTFGTETPELAQVDVGELIIGGVSTAAPEGFLRRVTSRQRDGDHLVFVTEQATLTDAFESISVNVQQQSTPADIQGIAEMPGVKLLNAPSIVNSGEFEFAMNNSVLYDQDGNLSTTGDQVVADGLLSVSPKIEFRLKIEDYELKELYWTRT